MTQNFDGVAITPGNVNFGCVSEGFVYHFSLLVLNKLDVSQKLRFACAPAYDNEPNVVNIVYVPKAIASGMSITLTIELLANIAANSHFNLIITQSGLPKSQITISIRAFVVPVSVFKDIKRALAIENKSMHREGVKIVESLGQHHQDERSAIAGTVFSEALMNDDEIDELFDLPLIPNVYWDPGSDCLKFEKDISQVSWNGLKLLRQI